MKKYFLISIIFLSFPALSQALTYNELILAQAPGQVLGESDPVAEIDNSPDDVTPPSSPTNFKAVGLDNQIALFWNNPVDTDFVRTVIVKRSGSTTPTSYNDGEIIYEGTEIGFVDKKVTNSQMYSYSAFAFDNVPNYSIAANAQAIPTANTKQLTFNTYSPKFVENNYEVVGRIYKTGTLVDEKGTIYLIIGINKVPFTNFTAFRGLGYQLKNVIKGDASSYLEAKTYMIEKAGEAHPWSSWLKNGRIIYYSHESGMIPIPTMEIFTSNGGDLNKVLNMNQADLKILKKGQLPLLELNDQRIYQ